MKCPKCNFENPGDTRFCGNCGIELLATKEAPISQTKTLQVFTRKLIRGSLFAGRYEIIEELGKGGMGKVYKVIDKKIDEEVALKLLKPEIADDEKTIARFQNELKFARKITHKNVCRMYDLSEEEGTPYITMEYVPGEDLKSLIRRIGQFTIGKAILLAKQACEGLDEAHKLGVVHRDLKPQNIMIDREGNARIMDFGIARSVKAEGITESGAIMGTPQYMSPEQVEGKKVDQRSDIYSLGAILYEMLTGRVPFEGDTPFIIAMKHTVEEPQDPREFNAQLPEDVSRMILKCMEKDRNKRYQGAEELLSELRKIEQDLPTTDKIIPKRKTELKIKRKRLRYFAVPAIILIFAMVIVGGYFYYDRVLQAGKKEKEEKATVAVEQTTERTEALAPQPGYLEINSVPKEAEVYIDDSREGITPLKREFPPGTYRITIKKSPGYEEKTDVLDVKAGETSSKSYTLTPQEYALAPQPGYLEISSVPKEAEVYIDDKREGITPLKREFPPGTYRITIKKSPGYEEKTDVLDVKAGETSSKSYTLTPREYALAPQPGYLEINSAPKGAEVYIDDKREGITPLKRELSPGAYRITIKKSPEYKERTDVLDVKAGKTSSKSYALVPVYILDINTSPEDASIIINGNYYGKTPIKIELSKSICQLRIEKGEEWSRIDESLTLKPGLNSLRRALKRITYSLSIRTNPPGARVSIGNRLLGTSPVKELGLFGVYDIKIENEGYKTIEESIIIKSDIVKTYELIKLKMAKIRLNVHPYADILIDGKLIGEVPPIRIQEVVEGKHAIEFISTRLNKKFTVEVEINAGESKEIRMNMITGVSKVVEISLEQ